MDVKNLQNGLMDLTKFSTDITYYRRHNRYKNLIRYRQNRGQKLHNLKRILAIINYFLCFKLKKWLLNVGTCKKGRSQQHGNAGDKAHAIQTCSPTRNTETYSHLFHT